MQFLFVTLETEGVDSTSDNILVSNLCEQVDWLALSQALLRRRRKKEPGIHCLCMHQIFNNNSYRRDVRDAKY